MTPQIILTITIQKVLITLLPQIILVLLGLVITFFAYRMPEKYRQKLNDLLLFAVLQVADFGTTLFGMNMVASEDMNKKVSESSLFLAGIMQHYSVATALVVKMVFATLLVALVLAIRKNALAAANVVFILIVANNFVALARLKL